MPTMTAGAHSSSGHPTYLLTGGTGLVGRNLLARLTQRRDARVLALVRPESQRRLEKVLEQLPAGERVQPLLGDVREAQLGIEDPEGLGIDRIVHAAAVYDLLADHSAVWEANVTGTANVVVLANRLGVESLHHVSTIGVAGRHRGRFRERDLECGQEIDNPYFRSKWYGERIVRARSRVLTRIYRPGIVVGHSETGEMTKIDGAYFAFAGLRRLSRLPTWLPLVGPRGGPANVVPADWVAAAIDSLIDLPADRFGSGATFHLVPERPGSAGDALNALARAAGAPRLRLQVSLRVTRPLGRFLRPIPGMARLRDRFWSSTGIPPRALRWRDFDTAFDQENLHAALNGSLPCPPFDAYVERLYGFWLRNLSGAEAAWN
jgi:nucleoside-diphosphate-sugar epimerase